MMNCQASLATRGETHRISIFEEEIGTQGGKASKTCGNSLGKLMVKKRLALLMRGKSHGSNARRDE